MALVSNDDCEAKNPSLALYVSTKCIFCGSVMLWYCSR